MAKMFLSESSRRTQSISKEEMDNRWEMAFGKQQPQTCSKCGRQAHETKNGICADCQRKELNFSIDKLTCVQCGNIEIRLNDLGLCYTCNAFNSMDQKNHGE